MSRDLPFPLEFSLPEGWVWVSPDASGHPDAAFVAVREDTTADPVAANLVISGLGVEDARVDVGVVAEEYLTKLLSRYQVRVIKKEVTAGSAAHAAQLLEIDYPVGSSTVTVNQIHLVNAFTGRDPGTAAMVQFVMTCPVERFSAVGQEFAQFVSSITVPRAD